MSYIVVLKGLNAPNIGLGEAVDMFETIKTFTPYWSLTTSSNSKNVYSDEGLMLPNGVTKIQATFRFTNNSNGNIFLVVFSKQGTNCEIVAKKDFALTSSNFNTDVTLDWDISNIVLEDEKSYYLGITSPTISSYTAISSNSTPEDVKSIWKGTVFQTDEEVVVGKTFTCNENVKNGSPKINVLFQKSLI